MLPDVKSYISALQESHKTTRSRTARKEKKKKSSFNSNSNVHDVPGELRHLLSVALEDVRKDD